MRHVSVLEQEMRNIVGFSEPIGGRYAGLFKPNDTTGGDLGGIFTQSRRGWVSSNQRHKGTRQKTDHMPNRPNSRLSFTADFFYHRNAATV
jgi:hypothetical protein